MVKHLIEFLVMNMFIILSFAIFYSKLPQDSFVSKKKQMTFFDYLYFSTITHTTLGGGNMIPSTNVAKLGTMLHSLGMFVLTVSWVSLDSFGK